MYLLHMAHLSKRDPHTAECVDLASSLPNTGIGKAQGNSSANLEPSQEVICMQPEGAQVCQMENSVGEES